jgi:hypothetical protein
VVALSDILGLIPGLKTAKIDIRSSSAKDTVLRSKNKTGWLGFRIMCPTGATCLLVERCFREQALQNETERVGLIWIWHHHLIRSTCSRHDIAAKYCSFGIKQHSLTQCLSHEGATPENVWHSKVWTQKGYCVNSGIFSKEWINFLKIYHRY